MSRKRERAGESVKICGFCRFDEILYFSKKQKHKKMKNFTKNP